MKSLPREIVMDEIRKNRNHSWFEEIYNRNKNNLDKTAMFYRGTKISYGEFFDLVIKYAKSLKQFGVDKGDEFVVCLRQAPDYPILFAAASYIGAKINLIAFDFDKDYIADIINNANSKIVFVHDWDFATIEESLEKSTEDKKIVVLPMDRYDRFNNPYSEITERFYKFDEDKFKNSVSKFDNIVSIDEFLDAGEKYIGEINGHGTLEDEVAITYTSGSTKKGFHKGIVQRNKTYIIMGRYHDSEVAGIPKMDKTISMSIIGTQADTTLMSVVSDTLMQGGTVALEPISDENYFLYSLAINKAGLAIASSTYWIKAMKDTYNKPEFKGLTLPGLYVPSEGGEPLLAGEEKALNRWLKDVKAGVDITHTPFSVAKMTIGGGDSEHGSIFLKLYRGYFNGLQKIRGIKEPIGLEAYDFVDLQVLREDGTYCNNMEMGRLVANSPISMEKYHNDEKATEKYFITDAYGKKWGDLGVYGYVDAWNNVYIKGRIRENDPLIKPFQIADIIALDTKNIMSCEVIPFVENNEVIYVAHIEFQFFNNVNVKKALLSAESRCKKAFGNLLEGKILFRVRSYEEGFPTLFTAKRDIIKLREEGITDKCIIPSEYYSYNNDNQVKLIRRK